MKRSASKGNTNHEKKKKEEEINFSITVSYFVMTTNEIKPSALTYISNTNV